MTIKEWAAWALTMWPNAAQRMQVAGEYAALQRSQHLMADLALRNHVYAPGPDVDNLYAAGVAEGRRRVVLEIFKLARIDPQAVARLHRAKSVGD